MKSHRKKMIAPVVVTLILSIYYVVYFGFLISLFGSVWRWILGIVPLAFIVLSIAVCVDRLREIRKGEEDDLSQY